MHKDEELKKIKTSLPIICVEEVRSSDQKQIVDWGLRQSKIPESWKVTKGEGVKILVIDSGHPFHSDMSNNSKIGENFVDNEPLDDLNGHQTHCTGIICAEDNKFGMVGVAPKSTCISVKALNKNGSGTLTGLVKALDFAIKTKPDIVSMSLGSSRPHREIENKIKTLYEMNIPVVCAAGNSGMSGVNWPAAYKETISIAAYDEKGSIASFSSKGPEVDWAGPGVKINSTYLNNGYATLSGTSMACPFIVGVIALMLSKHRRQEKAGSFNNCKTIEDIKQHLLKYTIDKGEKGKDNSWGYGIISVKDLIIEDSNPEPKPEPKPQPKPEPKPQPKPEPKPQPKPEPKPKESWIKKNIAWVVCGTFIIIALLFYLISLITKTEKIYVPWITEDGEVLWDEKMEWDNERR